MPNEINKIISYINKNYDIKATKKESFLYENNIYIATKKYDLNIGIGIPEQKHFLYGKTKYYLTFSYNANKKYRTELSWHGGGYDDKYNENEYSNIDIFLTKFCSRKKQKQLSIFDLGE